MGRKIRRSMIQYLTPEGQWLAGGTIYGRGNCGMFNIIIFLIGAGIMFYMAWRSRVVETPQAHDQGKRSRPL